VHTARPDEAETLGREAAAIAAAADDGWNVGWALGIRAAIAGLRGNMREAAELAGASVEVMRSIDHGWGVARAQLGLGDVARLRGDLHGAQLMYTDALGYLREIDARPEIARCLSGLGRTALDLGDIEAAREHLAESLRLSRDIGTHIGMARGLESSAALALREGDAERAVMLAAASVGLRATTGLPPLPGTRATRYLAEAQDQDLDEGTAALLWARGLALSPQAAIDLAIEQALRAPRLHGMPAITPTVASPGGLTPRELEIAALIASGRSNKAIGAELVISPATVARHVANIMTKLGFRSRAQIAAWITDRRLPAVASFFHGQLGGGIRLEPLVGNGLAAEHRAAVGAGLEPGERPVDRAEPVAELLGDRLVRRLCGQRQPFVAGVGGAVGGLLLNPDGFLCVPQQRGHLGPLRPQQRPRPAFVHARIAPSSARRATYPASRVTHGYLGRGTTPVSPGLRAHARWHKTPS
jgi:DNA-binding CsgD family transcriptional regulator